MVRPDLGQHLSGLIERENAGCADARQKISFLAAKRLTRYILVAFSHFYSLLSMNII
jgi:hypothetical protein